MLACAVFGAYYGKIKPEAEATERAAASALAEREADVAKKNKTLEKLQAQVNDLIAQLDGAKSDADKAALKAKIAEAQSAAAKVIRLGVRGAAKSGAGAKAACNCQPGDPLCSCLSAGGGGAAASGGGDKKACSCQPDDPLCSCL
jgi:colicin import membrane protein